MCQITAHSSPTRPCSHHEQEECSEGQSSESPPAPTLTPPTPRAWTQPREPHQAEGSPETVSVAGCQGPTEAETKSGLPQQEREEVSQETEGALDAQGAPCGEDSPGKGGCRGPSPHSAGHSDARPPLYPNPGTTPYTRGLGLRVPQEMAQLWSCPVP